MTPEEAGIESITSGWAAEFEGTAEFDEKDEGNAVVSVAMVLNEGVLLPIFKEKEIT